MISLVSLLITQRFSVRAEKLIVKRAQDELNEIHHHYNAHVLKRRTAMTLNTGTMLTWREEQEGGEAEVEVGKRSEGGKGGYGDKEPGTKGEDGEDGEDGDVDSPDLWAKLKEEEELYIERNGVFFLGVTAFTLLWIIGKVSIIRNSVRCG